MRRSKNCPQDYTLNLEVVKTIQILSRGFDKPANASSEQLPVANSNLNAYLQFGEHGLSLNLDRDDKEQHDGSLCQDKFMMS